MTKIEAGPPIEMGTVVLDCHDIEALSAFYMGMLAWERVFTEEGEWIEICSPAGGTKIAFQSNRDYIPPVWPEQPGAQQQMLHIDFAVKDTEHLARAVEHAVACGASIAEHQPSDQWTVMIDPAGHPFCFVIP
jgi:catechol-2,3-dioxygenase